MNQFWKLYSSPIIALMWLGLTFFSFQETQDQKQQFSSSQIIEGESAIWQLIEGQANFLPIQSNGFSAEKFQDNFPVTAHLNGLFLKSHDLVLQVIKTQRNVNPDYSIRKLIFPFHFFW